MARQGKGNFRPHSFYLNAFISKLQKNAVAKGRSLKVDRSKICTEILQMILYVETSRIFFSYVLGKIQTFLLMFGSYKYQVMICTSKVQTCKM